MVFASGSNVGALTMMSVTIGAGTAPSVSAPNKLFDFGVDLVTDGRFGLLFDVTHDGQRFVMVRERIGRPPAQRRWVLVQNWLTEFAAATR